jgi:hypothetical protein
VPQLRTKVSSKSRKLSQDAEREQTVASDIHALLAKMVDYEETALKNGIDVTTSRFKMLTASERDYVRAELVADYIRLSAGNTGRTPGYYDAALVEFCSKICDMELSSQELLGTYLAALNIIVEDRLTDQIPDLNKIASKCMIDVLHMCCQILVGKAKTAA